MHHQSKLTALRGVEYLGSSMFINSFFQCLGNHLTLIVLNKNQSGPPGRYLCGKSSFFLAKPSTDSRSYNDYKTTFDLNYFLNLFL